jgi:hypothetical protein
MPTLKQVQRQVAEFEREYPESLIDRLKWWVSVLGIDRIRLFRLMGLSGFEAARTPLTALPDVVNSHEDRAEIVDEMLVRLLASFDYDLAALHAALHSPIGPSSEKRRRGARRPGVVVPLPYIPRPEARTGILLNEIVAGGPSALPALMAYLHDAGNGGSSGARRAN